MHHPLGGSRCVSSISFGLVSVHSFRRRVASRASGVRRDRSYYVTYRLDLRVAVVLIAVVPATKVEVFADVANISSVSCVYLAWRVVPTTKYDGRPRSRVFAQAREMV